MSDKTSETITGEGAATTKSYTEAVVEKVRQQIAGTDNTLGTPGKAKEEGEGDSKSADEGAAGASSGSGTSGSDADEGTGKQTEDEKGKEGKEDELDKAVAELEKLGLDPELAKNPDIAKRWADNQKGVKNIVNLAKAAQAEANKAAEEFQELMPAMERVASWEAALADPKLAPDALADLIPKLGEVTGLSLKDLCGKVLELLEKEGKEDEIDEDEIQANYAKEGFDTPGEYRAYKRAKLEFQREQKASERARRDQANANSQADQKRDERERFIRNTAPTIVSEVAKKYNNFKITPEQVAEAIDTFPQFAKEPLRAVVKHLAEELATHQAAVARKPEIPEVPEGDTSSGSTTKLPPVRERTAKHYVAAAQQVLRE
jgi:ribosomal protein L15